MIVWIYYLVKAVLHPSWRLCHYLIGRNVLFTIDESTWCGVKWCETVKCSFTTWCHIYEQAKLFSMEFYCRTIIQYKNMHHCNLAHASHSQKWNCIKCQKELDFFLSAFSHFLQWVVWVLCNWTLLASFTTELKPDLWINSAFASFKMDEIPMKVPKHKIIS